MKVIYYILLVTSLLAFSASEVTQAAVVHYRVSNNASGTPGGERFKKEIGLPYSKEILKNASSFIWKTFRQAKGERKNLKEVSMVVQNMSGVAYAINNGIHVGANYIAGYSGDVKTEITGVLYHEMTHVWQWDGNEEAPGGLIEGIADYIRLKAGYVPRHWVKSGEGDRWDQGYDVSARFLDYCNGLKKGFVAALNKKMRDGYSDNFFVELLGQTVDQLWKNYKVKYESPAPSEAPSHCASGRSQAPSHGASGPSEAPSHGGSAGLKMQAHQVIMLLLAWILVITCNVP